jgi:hypothetical protein
MTAEQRNIWIILALLPILAFTVISNIGGKKAKTIKPQPELLSSLPGIVPGIKVPAGIETNVLEIQKKRAENTWGRDPFSSDIYKSGQLNSELKLKGISFRQDKIGFAFINNEIVKQGEMINGYKVEQILKDKVLLKKENQSFYLTFPEE